MMSDVDALPTPSGRRNVDQHWAIYGAIIQGRVIGALTLREMQTRFGRHNLGFLWLFLEPLVLGSVIGILHSAHGKALPGNVDPFLFSTVGYVPFFMFRAIVGRAGSALHSNLTLMFHRQVSPVDIIIARNLLEATAVTGVILLILGFEVWFVDVFPANIGQIFGAIGLNFLFAHGISMIIAAAIARFEVVERLVHPLTYLSMPLSGAFYALSWFPPSVREPLLWVPLVNIHEMIREGMFGTAFPSYYDLHYVVMWVLAVNLIGLVYLRTARRQLSIF